MSLRAACWITLCACAAPPLAAQRAWQPSLHVISSLERGRGSAFEARDGTRRDDDALSLGVGLDGRRGGARGGVEISALALAHDPATPSDRGLFAAVRLRATRELGTAWRLSLDESARVQRTDRLSLADWERNALRVGVERRTASGRTWGLAFSDQRRGVREAAALGFARQALLASFALSLEAGRELQIQFGPERFSADAGRGTRLSAALEWAAVGPRGALALRAAWLEPLTEAAAAGATQGPVTPARAPGLSLAFNSALRQPGFNALSPPPSSPPAGSSSGLLGDGLLIEPLDDGHDDWDLGRRKHEILAVGAWPLGARLSLSLYARLTRERGPDLLTSSRTPRVAQERANLRLACRRTLASRATLLLQGAWQGRREARAGFDYSRLALALGLEVRP